MFTQDSGLFSARELTDVLIRHGLKDIVLSPGSRNAPLLIACAARDQLRKHVINDERTAAFSALGIAMASQRPVALVCTSGTALYNYAPAVAEALYQKIPLVVITADRPASFISQEPQTLRQPDALRNITKGSFDIPVQSTWNEENLSGYFVTNFQWYVNRVANEALNLAMSGIKGPVHLNIQFEVPFNSIVPYEEREVRIVKNIPADYPMPAEVCRDIAHELIGHKVLVVAGQMPSNHKLNKAIAAFAGLNNVMVFTEPTSNLHLEPHNIFASEIYGDICDHENVELKPDVIITVGGLIVADSLNRFIKGCENATVWTLGDTPGSLDRYHNLTRHYEVSPFRFFKGIASMTNHLLRKKKVVNKSDYRDLWISKYTSGLRKFESKISEYGWTELKAVSYIMDSLPSDCNLFVSNGMLIRNVFGVSRRLPHNVWANRGVSGIEGTNATAFGTSICYKGITILLTGDMSFSYCTEILNLHRMGGDLRIIVVNNGGGDIFRRIATTRELECREEYFCNAPELPLEKLAEAYGWNYLKADSMETLDNSFRQLISTSKSIIEVFVNQGRSGIS